MSLATSVLTSTVLTETVHARELPMEPFMYGVVALGTEMKHAVLGRLGGHDLHDALGVNPWLIARDGELNAACETLG